MKPDGNRRVVVVGSLNMDLVARVASLPRPGETVHGDSFATLPGGKGANQAVAVGRLGGNVSMVGRVGDDAFGPALVTGLRSAGVDVSRVVALPGASGCAVIHVDAAGQNAITVIAGANAALRPEDLAPEAFAGAAVVLLQLETPLETIARAAALAAERSVPVVLDPAPARPLPAALLRNVTWLTPNETECEVLLGTEAQERGLPSLEDRAKALLALGVRNVVLKLGARGVYLAGADVAAPVQVPSPAVQAVDTTAAGDAFNGGFAFALARGDAPVQAAQFACAVAALSVTKAGAQGSMPSLAEVRSLLAR